MNFVQSTVRRAGCDNDRNCKRARTNKVTRAMMYITIAKTEKETENKRATVVTVLTMLLYAKMVLHDDVKLSRGKFLFGKAGIRLRLKTFRAHCDRRMIGPHCGRQRSHPLQVPARNTGLMPKNREITIARDDARHSTFSACEGKLNDQATQWRAPKSHPPQTTSKGTKELSTMPPLQDDIPTAPVATVRTRLSTPEPMSSAKRKSIAMKYKLVKG